MRVRACVLKTLKSSNAKVSRHTKKARVRVVDAPTHSYEPLLVGFSEAIFLRFH